MNKLKKILFIGALFVVLLLAACSDDSEKTVDESKDGTEKSSEAEGSSDKSKGVEGKEELEIVWIQIQSAAQSEQRDKEGLEDYIKEKDLNGNVDKMKGEKGNTMRRIRRRSVAETSERIMILAENDTYRRDPLDHFHRYSGGWNISNEHYWGVSLVSINLNPPIHAQQ